MTTTQLIGDLVARAVVIAVFLTISGLMQWTQHRYIATIIELMTQSLLIAFYCYEYKTAAACIDT